MKQLLAGSTPLKLKHLKINLPITAEAHPQLQNLPGSVSGEPTLLSTLNTTNLTRLETGSSYQSSGWLADNRDVWITYPQPLAMQEQFINQVHILMKLLDKFQKSFSHVLMKRNNKCERPFY